MQFFLTSGSGNERYTLRYPITITNGRGIQDCTGALTLQGFDRPAELLATDYGFLVIARDFSSYAAAKAFADRLHIAARKVSLELSLPIFTETEPTLVNRLENLITPDEPPKIIHGIAPETFYAIVREDELIMSRGEIRGSAMHGHPLTRFAHDLSAASCAPSLQCKFINIACDFWTLSCVDVGEVAEITNIVSALEVLSNITKRKESGAKALKAIIKHFDPRVNVVLGTMGINKRKDVESLCDRIWRRRSEFVHEGDSPETSPDDTQRAKKLCRNLILLAIADLQEPAQADPT